MAKIRITLASVKPTDKELIQMVSGGVVYKPDGSKVTLDDLEKVGIVVEEE